MSHPGILSKLVEEKEIPRVIDAFHKAIDGSFSADKSRVTMDETRRRFQLCLRIFTKLRGELRWSLMRIIDMLPAYLRCELEGIAYDPRTNSEGVFAPTTGGEFLR